MQELAAAKGALKGRYCHVELQEENQEALLMVLQLAPQFLRKACPSDRFWVNDSPWMSIALKALSPLLPR